MNTTGAGSLFRLAVETLREPKKCLRIVLDVVITMPELLQATALVVALSTLMSIGLLFLEPVEVQKALFSFSSKPIQLFLMQIATFMFSAALITYIGRFFKGYATFKEALTALVWLQFILFGISILQAVLGFVIPQLSPIVFIITMMIIIHLTVNFIMEIHGFKNPLAVIAGIVGTFFGLAFILSALLLLLGFSPEGLQNV
jgi:hypothetical protein